MRDYYRTWADIDLDAIRRNVLEQRDRVSVDGNTPKLCAVIKSDGYGHGAVPIARTIGDLVWGYAVATVDEAMQLRVNGIDQPILVLGFVDSRDFYDCIKHKIRIALYEKSIADELAEAVRKYRQETGDVTARAYAHLKIDTGMGRIGFLTCTEELFNASVETICSFLGYPEVNFEGCFMHFSKADEFDKTFANTQHDRFLRMLKVLRDRGFDFEIKHCDNSAGIIDIPEWHLDMVRMGISLYGLYPSDEVNKKSVMLFPAMSIRSRIVFIKDIPAGFPISYGGTFVSERPMRVATVPIGYADGYPRLLSNKGSVIICGKRAKILGRVCMDQMMVDITDIPEAEKYSAVTIVGKDGDECITVEELGEISGRFNYEFVCDITKRVPRVYYRGGQKVGSKDYILDEYLEPAAQNN